MSPTGSAIDLRSDTVTQPTPKMREAMAKADVGDDVYGEDPSVNELEELAAARLGKEAAVFIPSGTMGNLAAILAFCGRGDEIILGDLSHTFLYEAGGISALGGIHPRLLPNREDGTLDLEEIEAAVRPDNPHHPITRLIELENTHNRCGGAVISAEYLQSVAEIAKRHNLYLHLDGARIFNAAAALGVDAKEMTAPVDSVTFCLSKGLCAPVGSLLCGSAEFIKRARRIRKQLGGGMRQAGILAAAGIVALEDMVDRLAEDHKRAKLLAAGLSKLSSLRLENYPPASNMVYLSLSPESPIMIDGLLQALKERGVLVGSAGGGKIRMVLHYWIDDRAIDQVVSAFDAVLTESS
jgi:threonine aldolase